MKIPLHFYPKKNRVEVFCTIRFPPRGIPVPLNFVVDTGSPETFVNEVEVMRFRIRAESYPASNCILIGGNKIRLHKVGKAVIIFKNDKGEGEAIEFSDLKIAKSLRSGKKSVQTGASILGLNFLTEAGLYLYLNPAKDIAYFGKDR